ncbi:MAG: TonB-dependent receptor plug domain-containing protein [Deltaproteobacteria bacterium]|nr:TonB-dependent receptor plug domain-containing protein [Deltaproteobacteria bacterium]
MAMRKFGLKLSLCSILMGILAITPFGWAWGEEFDSPETEDTMLMFVGEDIDVLSIASRREESAWQAPAIARVISREELRDRGITTLSQALSMEPGFYMAQKEWGTLPYLRGIPNSALILYDTVPLNSDTTKSLHQLDFNLSLAPVKRIEIIRGPGSVLWGPDAFAGIVNLVPLKGKDLQGVETDIRYGTPGDRIDANVTAGFHKNAWDALLSISAHQGEADDRAVNLVRFWGNDAVFPPDERMGVSSPNESEYLDIFARLSFRDNFSVTGRLFDNRRPYAIGHPDADITWLETLSFPGGFIKVESKQNIDRISALRLTGYYTQFRPELDIIDRAFPQKEQTAYGELIYDRSFRSGRGLFTGGLSYREKWVDDANIWQSYLPDFLGPGNVSFLPIVIQDDYSTRLLSFFGQYEQKIGKFDLSCGLRYDSHDSYSDNLSFNIASVWNPNTHWIVKLLYGTAYRTPFARQLLENDSQDLEKIQNFSAQITWKPSGRFDASLVGFAGRIDDHIMEDVYARDLSQPNSQEIYGFEISGRYDVNRQLNISANLTMLENTGSDETFQFVNEIFVRPDGTIVEIFDEINYPFDLGADTTLNLLGTWRPTMNFSLFARLQYFSSRKLVFQRVETVKQFSDQWLFDVSARVKDFVFPGWDLSVTLKNLLDADYKTPGIYTGIDGTPAELMVIVRKKW